MGQIQLLLAEPLRGRRRGRTTRTAIQVFLASCGRTMSQAISFLMLTCCPRSVLSPFARLSWAEPLRGRSPMGALAELPPSAGKSESWKPSEVSPASCTATPVRLHALEWCDPLPVLPCLTSLIWQAGRPRAVGPLVCTAHLLLTGIKDMHKKNIIEDT